MENSEKRCWCYVTYAFAMDSVPPLPLPRPTDGEAAPEPVGGFEPTWFLNAKFPEDEE
ncbi:MAG: hypothetical protein J1F63_09400 [Oscillospiraceae bacterium]|nr:hypothetical protein [Oscillospiraceae bacterium]